MHINAGNVLDTLTKVTQWTDLTSNLNDAKQAAGSKQGTLVADALNGHPEVVFDGGDDYGLPLGDPLAVAANSPFSLYYVAKVDTTNDIVAGSTANNTWMRHNSASQMGMKWGNNTSNIGLAPTISLGNYHLVEIHRDSADACRIIRSGVQVASFNKTQALINLNVIGSKSGTGFLIGSLLEFAMVPNVEITAEEEVNARALLLDKYALP